MNLYDVIHQQDYPVGSLVIKDVHQRLSNTAGELNLYAHNEAQPHFDTKSHETFLDVFLKFTHHTEAYLSTLRADRRKKLVNTIKAKIDSLATDYELPVKQVYQSNGQTVIELW